MENWPGGATYQLLAVRPQSRGSVKLQAADVTEPPAIDLGYLSDAAGVNSQHLLYFFITGLSRITL
jgi:hypothetical protein